MRVSLHLVSPRNLCAGLWWGAPGGHGRKMRTAWAVVGPLALCLRLPRWPGERR